MTSDAAAPPPQDVDESELLWRMMQALGGGGARLGLGSRSEFLFAHVDLPQVVNEMAAQTLLLNQDRYAAMCVCHGSR